MSTQDDVPVHEYRLETNPWQQAVDADSDQGSRPADISPADWAAAVNAVAIAQGGEQ